jgi:dTDP-4-dehydrorhamnose reductase
MKKTILIFGVSSFVGSNLLEILKADYRIIGTYFKTPVKIPGITCVPCDVLRKDYVSSLISRFRPDFTIYAVGMSSLKSCSLAPKQSDALNSAGAANCAAASERYDSRFVFISSAYVLGGDQTICREGETPFPNTAYGSALSSSEFYVQRSCLNYLILRCSSLYGRSYNPAHPNWFEALETSLAKGMPLEVDDKIRVGFLDVYFLGLVLKALLDKNARNRLFHVSSKDFMTRYEFAQLYARTFHKDPGLIIRSGGKFPVEKNKSSSNDGQYSFCLDTSNIEEFLNAKMPGIEDSLAMTHKRFHG